MNDKMHHHNSETIKHVNRVRELLWSVIFELDQRAKNHDASKFEMPENEILAKWTPELATTDYTSQEYVALLEKVKPALEHHYSKNRHHPEHFPDGIKDMTLIDLIEMLCDWKAATDRNKNGNIRKSIEHNAKRFNMSPDLERIFLNTVKELFD